MEKYHIVHQKKNIDSIIKFNTSSGIFSFNVTFLPSDLLSTSKSVVFLEDIWYIMMMCNNTAGYVSALEFKTKLAKMGIIPLWVIFSFKKEAKDRIDCVFPEEVVSDKFDITDPENHLFCEIFSPFLHFAKCKNDHSGLKFIDTSCTCYISAKPANPAKELKTKELEKSLSSQEFIIDKEFFSNDLHKSLYLELLIQKEKTKQQGEKTRQ